MVYHRALNIYADGSSYSHPRRGGMGIRYVTINLEGDEVVQSEEIPGHLLRHQSATSAADGSYLEPATTPFVRGSIMVKSPGEPMVGFPRGG